MFRFISKRALSLLYIFMADIKENDSIKYKFGENEIDLKRYIYNIDRNVASYLQSKNWTSEQKQEFMSAYNQYFEGLKDQLANNTNRFTTNSFGAIVDSTGALFDTDSFEGSDAYYNSKGEQITAQDYNALRQRKQKKYQTFQANQQVASYFDKVGRGLLKKVGEEAPKKEETPSTAFDISKHGFVKYWGDRYNPEGGTFDGTAVLELDPLVDGKRERTNRTARLKQDFADYIAQLGEHDFSGTRYKTRDDYVEAMNKVIGRLDDGLGEDDLLELGQAGMTREFLNPFLSTEKTVTVSDADKAAEDAKKKADVELAEKKAREEAMRKFIENQQTLSTQSIGNSYSDNNWFTVEIPYNEKWYNHDGTFNNEEFLDTLPKDANLASMINSFISDPYNIKWGNQRYALLKYIVDSGKAQPITNNASLQGFYYIPRASDRAKATALVYNPNTQQMFETFIGNTHLWDSIMADFKRNQGWLDPTSPYMRKEGGILYAQQGANLGQDVANYIGSLSRQNLEERANKAGKTANQQKASERYINADNASYINPDAGFTDVEWSRLIAGGADIVSALSAWAPGAGTAISLGTGLGSTAANLYADINDDSVSAWDATKNTFLNLGMDLVGLVPGGGAASKFAKIGKNLVKVAPKVLALIGTAGHALNTPQYINSWSKLSSDEKLDAQDWNNILSSIQAILGPAAGIGQYAKNKGLYGKNKATKAYKADTGVTNSDKVAVKMLDNTGKEKTVLFEGDDAVAIRRAQESGKLDDLKAVTVDKFEDLDGWKLQESSFSFLKRPKLSTDLNELSPIGYKPTNVNDLVLDVTTRHGDDFARVRGFHDDITSFHTPGRRWQDIDDAYVESQMIPLKSKSDAYQRMYDYTQKKSADLDTQIATASNNLSTAKSGGSNKTSAELDVLVQQMKRDKSNGVHINKQNEIISSQNNLVLAQKEIASAERKIRSLEKQEIAATTETSRVAIRNQIEDAKLAKETAAKKAQDAQKVIDDNTKWLNNNSDARLAQLEAEQLSVKSLEDAVQKLKDDKVKYDKYTEDGKTKLREDFESRYPTDADGNITMKDPNTGREIVRNFKEILEKYKIRHKKGGTIKPIYKYFMGSSITKPFVEEVQSTPSQETYNTYWDTFFTHSIPRALYANTVNKNITKKAIQAETPFYQKPYQQQVSKVVSSLEDEARTNQTRGLMNSLTSKMYTSDINPWLAGRLEGLLKTEEIAAQNSAKSNQIRRASEEQARQQINENAKFRHDASQQNILSGLKTLANISAHERAYLNKQHEIVDTAWKERQFKLDQKMQEEQAKQKQENESFEKQYNTIKRSEYVTDNLATLDPTLNPEGIQLYQQVKEGKLQPSEIAKDPAKYQLFTQTYKRAQELELEEHRISLGIPESKWATVRGVSQGDPITIYKKGDKLKIQNSKVRTKNADRFAKQIKSDLDRNEKVLARLSKSLYSYINSKII